MSDVGNRTNTLGLAGRVLAIAVLGVAAAVVHADAEDLAGGRERALVGDVVECQVGLVDVGDDRTGLVDPLLGEEIGQVARTVDAPAQIDHAGAVVRHRTEGRPTVVGVAQQSHLAYILNMLHNGWQCRT